MEKHQEIIADLKSEFESNEKVLAMLVTGSAARGEAVDGNDLDILLVTEGERFSKEYRVGTILVEIGTVKIPQSIDDMKTNPMRVYMYLDAQAVFDRGNYLAMFQKEAKRVLEQYFKENASTNQGYQGEGSYMNLCDMVESGFHLTKEFNGIVKNTPILEIDKLTINNYQQPTPILFTNMIASSKTD